MRKRKRNIYSIWIILTEKSVFNEVSIELNIQDNISFKQKTLINLSF